MPFLQDFLFYASGNECPPQFLTWSGISLLGAVAGRKIWTVHGDYFPVYLNNYVCMVGTPGSGKSTGMNQAEDLFIQTLPEYKVSESIQSREDILRKMNEDDCVKTWKDETGEYGLPGALYDWRPFYCIVDEMENFVSVDEKKMIGMLVGIYSRNSFGTGFKNDPNPKQRIMNPYLNLLACTIPEWMMSSLRVSLFVGGLGRRMIIVHGEKEKEIPNPTKPKEHEELWKRMQAHLTLISKVYGRLDKTPDAKKWFDDWYVRPGRKNKVEPVLIQFHETQHIQLLKIAALLALSEKPDARLIDTPHLAAAYSMLQELEPGIIKLTSGIGRNELAGVGAQLLEYLERMGGASTESTLRRYFRRYLDSDEFKEILDDFQKTGQLHIFAQTIKGHPETVLATPGSPIALNYLGRMGHDLSYDNQGKLIVDGAQLVLGSEQPLIARPAGSVSYLPVRSENSHSSSTEPPASGSSPPPAGT